MSVFTTIVLFKRNPKVSFFPVFLHSDNSARSIIIKLTVSSTVSCLRGLLKLRDVVFFFLDSPLGNLWSACMLSSQDVHCTTLYTYRDQRVFQTEEWVGKRKEKPGATGLTLFFSGIKFVSLLLSVSCMMIRMLWFKMAVKDWAPNTFNLHICQKKKKITYMSIKTPLGY